ncbi:matrixin family metalloprotease [bacterium]|nr:matrixin family metalloprotease [bacterium]
MLYKSPFSAAYNYNKAKSLYISGQYEQSIPLFEKALFATPKDILIRFYYIRALSKVKPTYSVQKKLFEMSNSTIDDEVKKYAKYQINYLRHSLLSGVEDNYIFQAVQGSDIVRWNINSFPLKVYIEEASDIPEYYIQNIQEALGLWTEKTNFVEFEMVNTAENADILIKFKTIPDDICSGNVCKYTVAYTEPIISADRILRRMELTFYKTNPQNVKFTEREIYNTALHEIGHTLGIMGHSDNFDDVMYAENEGGIYSSFRSSYQGLSRRDIRTLVLLYRLEPSVSNVKNLKSETFYYSPLILGNQGDVLMKKLEELQKYIKNYPEMASGYINIASVYVDMGDFDNALQHLNFAEKYVVNSDERFLIEYNRAVIYYNMQDLDKSLIYANKAKAIKNDQNVQDLISDIQKFK